MIDNILIIFLIVTASLSFLTAMGQLFVKQRRFENINLFILFICLTVQILQLCIVFSDYIFQYPQFIAFHTTILYILGPVLYWAYYLVSIHDTPVPVKKIISLIPAIIVVCFDIFFAILPYNEKLEIIRGLILGNPYQYNLVIDIILIGAGAQCFIYQFLLIKKLIIRKKKGENVNIISITIGYTIFSTLFMILLIIGYVFSSLIIIKVASVSIAFLLIGAFLIGQRYPEFLQLVIIDAVSKRYKKSRLEGIDIEVVNKKLEKLMNEEKAFADEDISLYILARDLSITTHQLSQFLNERLNMNFQSFINQERIKEAMNLLIEEPDRNIVSIAKAVGFNSKSSFYEAFSRFTEKTPNQYRKDNLPDK